jgi:hypothetical protein
MSVQQIAARAKGGGSLKNNLRKPPQNAWLEGNVIGVINPGVAANSDNPRTEIIYQNAVYDDGYLPAGADWYTVNAGKTVYGVDNGIPHDAIAIMLSGVLIISPGYATESADLQLYIRRHGAAPSDGDIYLCAQTTAVAPGNGARTNFTTMVPVVDRKFDIWWHRSTGGYWPDHASYGIIAWPIAYVRQGSAVPTIPDARLDRIEQMLADLMSEFRASNAQTQTFQESAMTEIDDLLAAVTEVKSVEDGAVVAIQTLLDRVNAIVQSATDLADLKAAVAAETAVLRSNAEPLAAAIADVPPV